MNVSKKKLVPKQRIFVHYYLVKFNATWAAEMAGYSAKTAYSQGQRLLKNVEIAAAIEQGIKEKLMSADETMIRLADIARGDVADLMDITPAGFEIKLVETDETGEQKVNPKTKLIKKIKQKVTTFLAKGESDEDREVIETEIELYSAFDALNSIAKHHKLFSDAAIEVQVEAGESLLTALDKIYGAKQSPAPAPADGAKAEDDHASD